jgi:hypothetical protein
MSPIHPPPHLQSVFYSVRLGAPLKFGVPMLFWLLLSMTMPIWVVSSPSRWRIYRSLFIPSTIVQGLTGITIVNLSSSRPEISFEMRESLLGPEVLEGNSDEWNSLK